MATERLFTEQPHCSSTDNSQLHPDSKPLTATAGEEATPDKDKATAEKPPVKAEKKTSVQIVEPEYKGYTIVKVEEKHGPLHNAIPCMPLPIAIICCILNIVAPGIGTLLSAPTVLCCATTRLKSKGKAFCLNIVSALLQTLTCLLIVGWIWSILWAMTFVQLSCAKGNKESPKLNKKEINHIEKTINEGE